MLETLSRSTAMNFRQWMLLQRSVQIVRPDYEPLCYEIILDVRQSAYLTETPEDETSLALYDERVPPSSQFIIIQAWVISTPSSRSSFISSKPQIIIVQSPLHRWILKPSLQTLGQARDALVFTGCSTSSTL